MRVFTVFTNLRPTGGRWAGPFSMICPLCPEVHYRWIAASQFLISTDSETALSFACEFVISCFLSKLSQRDSEKSSIAGFYRVCLRDPLCFHFGQWWAKYWRQSWGKIGDESGHQNTRDITQRTAWLTRLMRDLTHYSKVGTLLVKIWDTWYPKEWLWIGRPMKGNTIFFNLSLLWMSVSLKGQKIQGWFCF